MKSRKIIVFGATSSVGIPILEQALTMGHQVTAFTRNPDSIVLRHTDLTIIKGDVLNKAQVDEAVASHDAVLCTLGAGRKGHLREAGTRNIVAAMQAHNVDRLICQSTLGVGDSSGNLTYFWKHIMFGLLLKSVLVDHRKQESVVAKANLNWTIVRPAAFTNGPLTKNYQHGFSAHKKNLTLKISRSDVADFMLKLINCDAYNEQAVGLSY